MPAPWVWIFAPLVAGFLSYLIRRFERANLIFGMTIALSLALLAWLRPIGVAYSIGSVSFELSESLSILGRRFVIQPEQTRMLVFIYLGVAFWFGGALIARAGRLFAPAGLTIAGLATAALSVEPFLYAALLIEVAAILCVPLLSPPGRSVDRGTLRFLIYQTLSVPCILFTGWLLAGAEAIPADSLLVTRAALLLAVGFSLMLAVFPFHSWMPMVAQSANLYVAAFVFYMFPLIASLYGLGFLERYAWLRTSPDVYTLFLWVGIGMAILGGVGAALQQHLGRMLAMAMMLEIGLGLAALGLLAFAEDRRALLNIYFASLLPRGLGLGVWALAGEVLARHAGAGEVEDRLHLRHFRSAGLALPITAGALVLAQLTFSGFPLTAGFPVRFGLWQGLSAHSQSFALLALLASFGVLLAALRTMTVLASGSIGGGWRIGESRAEGLLLSIGGAALLAAGVFPQLYVLMVNAANLFANLGQ